MTGRLPTKGALAKAIKGALAGQGRVAGRTRVTATGDGWRVLVVRDARGHELVGLDRIIALAQWRETGACDGYFEYRGEAHEDPADARTWGPLAPHDVDWRGFPPLMFDRYAALP